MQIEMGVVEIYDDFITEEQAKLIIDTVENISNDEDINIGFEDAIIGKGHKGGNIRSNQVFYLSTLANEPPGTRLYRDAIKANKENYFEDIKNIQNLISNRMNYLLINTQKNMNFQLCLMKAIQYLDIKVVRNTKVILIMHHIYLDICLH